MPPLPQSIVQASDQIRTHFLGAAPAPPPAGPSGNGPPPPPGAFGPATSQGPLQWTGAKVRDPDAFFKAVAALFGLEKRPYPTTTREHNFDYGGWFNYFYSETFEGRSAADDVPFGRLLSVVFPLQVAGARSDTLALGGPLPLAPSPTFANLLATSPGGVPKDVLQYLFEQGFRRADLTNAGSYFLPELALVSNMSAGVAYRAERGDLVFAYRGDTRSPDQVKQNLGAKCRADLDFWRRDASVDAAWHPWSDINGPLGQMWFRKGSKDNDYFTLNSLARNFHVSCAYPMFRSFQIDQRLTGPVAGWDRTKRDLLQGSGVKIVRAFNRKTRQQEEVLSDDGCIYVCVLVPSREVAKTWELNEYPESGIRNVRLEDMLAYIRIKRYHHPPETAGEHYDSTRREPSMTIKTFSWSWVRSEEEARATLGCTPGGMKTVVAKLNALMGKKFDISHTKHFPDVTYDPDIVPVTGISQPVESGRVRIGW
jgi:hypothetical protein